MVWRECNIICEKVLLCWIRGGMLVFVRNTRSIVKPHTGENYYDNRNDTGMLISILA